MIMRMGRVQRRRRVQLSEKGLFKLDDRMKRTKPVGLIYIYDIEEEKVIT
jgi:hypothetical protein